jgi:protocatechuate 3,4-dioxygenase beta subunit
MKRNVVLAVLVVIVVALWRIHVHHTQVAASTATTSQLHSFTVARASRADRHGASLAGTVRDDSGAAIAGASVCADATSSALPGDMTRDPRCATTGVTGAFTISNLHAADYGVSATAKLYTPAAYAPDGPDKPVRFPLAATEQRRGIDVVLHRGGVEVTGTISDAGGGVIAHAQVRVYSSWQRYDNTSVVVETDERGHYAAWTRAGAVAVTAGADGYAPVTRQGSAPAELDLVLVPESILSGKVVDAASGEPVADVIVGATAVDNSAYADTTLTDSQGRFTIDRLPPGRYTASARAPHGTGLSDGSTELGLGQRVDGVVVRLHPAYQVVARVLADGKPCMTATLGLVDEHQNLQPDVTSEADGTLHADGVLPGIYIPSPTCDGYVHADHYDPIVVVDRDVMTSWTVDAGASIVGRIRTQSGQPLASADIGVWSVETAARVPTAYGSDRASRDGDYAVRGLRAGRYRFMVSRPDPGTGMGGSTATELVVDVAAKATVHRDIVVPDAGGSIAGRVTTAYGAPGRVLVQARPVGGAASIVQSDDGGRFEISSLDPGTYELVVSGATDHGLVDNLTPGEPTTAVVRAGQTTTANLVIELPSGVIRGRVVDDRGAPVTDAFVGLGFEHDDAPAIGQARGDGNEILAGSDGRFRANHLSKGPYSVRAYRKGGGEAIAAHVAIGSDITLVLKATGDITGLAHRTGAAIDDLHVSIFDRDTDERLREETFFRTGGKFALRGVPAGHYWIRVGTGGSERQTMVDLAAEEHATLDVALEGNVTVVGRAIDARTRKPVAGIQMLASVSNISWWSSTASDLRNVSDPGGRFEVVNVPRGRLEITGRMLDLDGHVFDPVTVHRVVTAEDPDVIDLGEIFVVSTTTATRGDAGLSFEVSGEPAVARAIGVEPDGPAGRAGIANGDVIIAIDGIAVTGGAASAASTLVTGNVGDAIAVTLDRGETVTIVLGKS